MDVFRLRDELIGDYSTYCRQPHRETDAGGRMYPNGV